MSSPTESFISLLNQIRTDERFPDLAWIPLGLFDSSSPPHPISGLPLYFGSRNCPSPVTRLRWLHAGPAGARFEWIRDRVDPVFHCPNRHTCKFIIHGLSRPEPFSARDDAPVTWLPEGLFELLENALLQDSELGFLQCVEAEGAFTVERVTRGMIGPLWSATCAPDALAPVFTADPAAALLHLPLDQSLREPGPSIADDPLAPLFGEGGALGQPLARLRSRFGYRVVRERRAYLKSTHTTLEALRDLLPGLCLIPIDTGEI